MGIKKLWIEDGCTVCHLCESTAPDVFTVDDTTSHVKEGAEQFFQSLESDIKDAAAGCPVEIIKFEEE
ncbi:MAG: ferredoxin [Bacteroidia bacterium]